MNSFSKNIFILCLTVLYFENSPTLAARWAPTLENSPNLHTTTLEIDLSFNSPPPGVCVVDLTSMGESTWQAKIPAQGKTSVRAKLSTKDFTCINPGKIGEGLTFGYTILVEAKDPKVQKMAVRWSGNNGTVYPWEVEPKAVAKEGAVTWWPGLHRNNAGILAGGMSRTDCWLKISLLITSTAVRIGAPVSARTNFDLTFPFPVPRHPNESLSPRAMKSSRGSPA
jgi:hypothetical protein